MWQAEYAEITVIVENWVDPLLPESDSGHCYSRFGLVEHFDPKRVTPVAEGGISLLVRVRQGRHTSTTLFDVGLSGHAVTHNLGALRVDPGEIDQVVISHGHPDHFGGIYALFDGVETPLPVVTHPDAFLPRYVVMGDSRAAPFYNHEFREDLISGNGGRVVVNKDPMDFGLGVFTTGEIPREVSFEGPPTQPLGAPGLWQVSRDGHFVPDQVWDEQGLVIDIKDEGLIVLTGCSHAGVINTIHRARSIAGDRPVIAAIGGFHLGFPTTPAQNVAKTVEAMTDLEVRCVVPMHCSGLRAHAAFSRELPDRYVQPAVGTTFRFGS
jgi:7,8-dihydropterin-6-yl-methyl-4-(beta-D-ribofuranosyl)aminobenzene 5'-phosphate synthase